MVRESNTFQHQPHKLLPVHQEVSDLPADGISHVHLRKHVLEKVWKPGIEGRAEVYKQDPGIGSWGVQVLQDEV